MLHVSFFSFFLFPENFTCSYKFHISLELNADEMDIRTGFIGAFMAFFGGFGWKLLLENLLNYWKIHMNMSESMNVLIF
jgi:hypothetical protein